MGSQSMMRRAVGCVGLATILLGGVVSPADAMTCPGVEQRIVNSDNSLGSRITEHIAIAFRTFNAMLTTQFQQLVSAQKTLTAQQSTSGDQIATMALKSAEASASAGEAMQEARQIGEANDEFQSVGYNACGMEDAMQQFYATYETAFTEDPTKSIAGQIANAPGVIASPKGWFGSVMSGSNTSASALFNGDMTGATQYINTVMGPPRQFSTQNRDANAGIFQAEKTSNDARRSAAFYVLSSIAKEHATEGPQAAMENVVNQYVGDGGERWSAAMAGSHRRGILLDAARLEAANVAQEAYAVRKTQRTELAIAAYVLTRASNLMNDQDSGGVQVAGAQ